MARLTRVYQKVFASNASNNGVFGSLQAGNPTTSNNVATLQSLSAFENGWDDAAYSGDKLPPLEEFQGIQYGISYQQAYMLQEGIAEWDASTPYYKGSLTKTISGTSFKLYCSLQDNNTGNIVTNTSYWKKVMDSDDVYAFDSAVAHLSGTETISGDKTFSGSVSLNGTIAAGQTVKKTIIEWGRPDLTAGISIETTFTAPSTGFIWVWMRQNDSSDPDVKINGVQVYKYYHDGNNATSDNIWIPVSEGDEYVGNIQHRMFFPCKGV